MKKNAIIIAGILFAAGATKAQDSSYDRYRSSDPGQKGSVSTSTETVTRDEHSNLVVPTTSGPSTAVQHDPALDENSRGGFSARYNGENYEGKADKEFKGDDSKRDTDYEAEHAVHPSRDISADSSVRGGSLDARGYRQWENNDEVEPAPNPINPGKQADSSIRGGSIYARERNWNSDSEPSSGKLDKKRYMKADSSIRGGSLEARGGRDVRSDRQEHYRVNESSSRDDSGQGGSATWESDKGYGSVRGSSNWNPSDDLLRDGMDVESQSAYEYERNNDASVGGAATSERGSSQLKDMDDIGVDSSAEYSSKAKSSGVHSDLNASGKLEENISGEYELNQREGDRSSDLKLGTSDPNSADTTDSSLSSSRSTDIVHDDTDMDSATKADLSSDMEQESLEATGAAAGAESGSSSSQSELNSSEDWDQSFRSDSFQDANGSFQSNDPALRSHQTPIRENDPGFLYQDNRARGVGSLSTGELGTAAVSEQGSGTSSGSMSDQELGSHLKSRLAKESTGTFGLTSQQVSRNIDVSVHNGEVTLSGTAPSEQDRKLIEIRAAEMPGVKRVHNEITVSGESSARDLDRGSDLEDHTSDLQH